MSRTVRRLLREICSYNGLSEPNAHRSPGRLLDVEEVPRLEAPEGSNDPGWEALDERVQRLDLIVVELPGERDLRLRPGELLLQGQEVLVGLELRVVLGDGDQAADPRRELVLGLGLILDPRCRLGLGAGPRDLLEHLP